MMIDRERDHERLKTLIGAFSDGELEPDTARAVAEHLRGCQRCRSELQVQRQIAARLIAEPVAPAPTDFRRRIVDSVRVEAEAPGHLQRVPGRPRRAFLAAAPWTGWAAAAVIAGVWAATSPAERRTRDPAGDAVATRPAFVPDEHRIPMVEEALANYGLLTQQELPIRTGDPGALESLLPFRITPLSSPELQLLGAWTTMIRGEQAAVVAYRWRNRVLVQYVVSEELFFRQPVVRQAVADKGMFSVIHGTRSLVAWPEAGAGSLVIGDVPIQQLERLRS
jgi:anti-sigma factor RsiW